MHQFCNVRALMIHSARMRLTKLLSCIILIFVIACRSRRSRTSSRCERCGVRVHATSRARSRSSPVMRHTSSRHLTARTPSNGYSVCRSLSHAPAAAAERVSTAASAAPATRCLGGLHLAVPLPPVQLTGTGTPLRSWSSKRSCHRR